MSRRCCGTSVGVLIDDADERTLMITRGWWPLGIAPVAGHVHDEHASVAEALVAEVREEVNLEVTNPSLLLTGHLPNRCASLPATPPGHYWWVYAAQASGTPRPAVGETRGARWYTREEVQQLAERTLAHARGHITAAEFAANPGLEAVWVQLLADLGDLEVDHYDEDGTTLLGLGPRDRERVRALYTQEPPAYWRGGRPKS